MQINDRRASALLGLGADYSDEPWLGTPSTSTSSASTQNTSSFWNKAMDLLKTGSEVYQNVKSPSGGSYQPNTPPPPSPGMGTGTKVLIGAGAVTVIGGIIYFATRKKSKAK